MITELLKENHLTDNLIHWADPGKVFKGGYIAIIEEHTFLNGWNDKKHIRKFRKLETVQKYLDKNYPELS